MVKNTSNNKAFTLIELLVVVAIIGILAAVGVVAYNGYTSAKKSSSTSNHNTIVKYISTEIRKCDLGESSIMDNKVSCSEITVYNKIALAVAGPNGVLNNLENPYNKGFKKLLCINILTITTKINDVPSW